MAINTEKKWRNMVLYSVFVRNYSPEGTFEAVRRDLERIKELGTDIVWLLPIHPIGKKQRKGSLGSPYAISDYRGINPEYGSLEDFKRLVEDIHAHGMKCIIDVVYNHTSPDSWLAVNHPEWFFHKPDGSFGNRIADWHDVIDLDYSQRGLWDYQIDTLKMWAGIVDGFRCDVAPLVPLEFWLEARQKVAEVNPDCFWLAESVEPYFTTANRARGIGSLSDSEIFQAFDASYEYDIFYRYRQYLKGQISLADYAWSVNQQEAIYPENYVKLRCLENHDNSRAAFVIGDQASLISWTAFAYFQKGMTMVYNGQERATSHLPGLFDKDTVQWDAGEDISGLMKRLYEIKQAPIFADSSYEVQALGEDTLIARHTRGDKRMLGIFPIKGVGRLMDIDIPNGIYTNLIDGSSVEVHMGMLHTGDKPIIVELN